MCGVLVKCTKCYCQTEDDMDYMFSVAGGWEKRKETAVERVIAKWNRRIGDE